MKPIVLVTILALLCLPGFANARTTETLLYSFQGIGPTTEDGAYAQFGLLAGPDNTFYGTTAYGGLYPYDYGWSPNLAGYGTVFELSQSPSGTWTETVLYAFTGQTDGSYPQGSLIMDKAGNLYGTTFRSPSGSLLGTVFKLTPPATGQGAWVFTTLHSFAGEPKDGGYPTGILFMDTDGNLFGTTFSGGEVRRNCWEYTGCGTVYELSPAAASGNGNWTERIIYKFNASEGDSPWGGIVGYNGSLFGTTTTGGDLKGCRADRGCGVVFQLSPPASGSGAWTEAILHTFTGNSNGGTDGDEPGAYLYVDANGNLFGTTFAGGTGCKVDLYNNGCGTAYELSPPTSGSGAWTETILHYFGRPVDGRFPYGNLVANSAGELFGTTYQGGENPQSCRESGICGGTVFKLIPTGSGWREQILHRFKGPASDGAYPWSGLVFGADGALYGTTPAGGTGACPTAGSFTQPYVYENATCGTIFQLK